MTKSKYIIKALTYTDRLSIQNGLKSGLSQRQISLQTDISRTSIGREIKRCQGSYNAEEAQLHFDETKREKIQKHKQMIIFKKEIETRLQYLESKVLALEKFIKNLSH